MYSTGTVMSVRNMDDKQTVSRSEIISSIIKLAVATGVTFFNKGGLFFN
jgi:hypothetical protein